MSVYLYEKEIECICFTVQVNPLLNHYEKIKNIPLIGGYIQDEQIDLMVTFVSRAKAALRSQQIVEVTGDEAWILHYLMQSALNGGRLGDKVFKSIFGVDESSSITNIASNIVRKLEQEFSWLTEENV